ncbi:hypothetical protein JXA40_09615 [bacterium]|nr:hypothetical protein [candidate division CSSED10-310 bacterium]
MNAIDFIGALAEEDYSGYPGYVDLSGLVLVRVEVFGVAEDKSEPVETTMIGWLRNCRKKDGRKWSRSGKPVSVWKSS